MLGGGSRWLNLPAFVAKVVTDLCRAPCSYCLEWVACILAFEGTDFQLPNAAI